MNIYTRTGDAGQTSVIGGRVSKDDSRIEAYGTLDELNSFVGQAISLAEIDIFTDMREHLLQIQHELFDCGSDLAFVNVTESRYKVTASMVEILEKWIDAYEEENPALEKFILPGGTQLASVLHVCRTICRRAERRIVTLGERTQINPEVLKYVNRLSDLFFSISRTANAREGVRDIDYERSANVFRTK
ncbi:cob(I)alamin adenosyltransferase [Paenibacillus shirakamiensis]|uniref:Corrinoid adenosyltransferase n=2 Tax=Paenibacillus shirakamiensis TaxID=1265935 RepID=A0ABS4JFI1_9BACL|nr:cob(I)yrinic acid a,c-diamide adenosyltransferase [Paenibacillus shirakamiensis]MBP2000462.1 cob(I)alamin adenosyltransferase [Paenibacillus shirakamiensis]